MKISNGISVTSSLIAQEGTAAQKAKKQENKSVFGGRNFDE